VGLPRSSLVKSKPAGGQAVVQVMPAPAPERAPLQAMPATSFAPVAAPPAASAPAPISFAPASSLAPVALDTEAAPVSFAPVSASNPFAHPASQDPFAAAAVQAQGVHSVPISIDLPPREAFPSAPSTADLLARAAADPARPTWESLAPPVDPVLDSKRTPEVAERRARLTRIVQGTLGLCAAVCVVAVVLTGLSTGPSAAAGAKSVSSPTRGVPASAEVSVEPLGGPRLAKAPRRGPTMPVASVVRSKRR